MTTHTRNFSYNETKCKCGCGASMDQAALNKFQKIRDMMGVPMKVNSGKRCEQYNKQIGGAPMSQHIRGLALDVDCPDEDYKHRLMVIAAHCGVGAIGIYRNFLHLDHRHRGYNKPPVIWADY